MAAAADDADPSSTIDDLLGPLPPAPPSPPPTVQPDNPPAPDVLGIFPPEHMAAEGADPVVEGDPGPEGAPPVLPQQPPSAALTRAVRKGGRQYGGMDEWGMEGEDPIDMDAEELASRGGRLQLEDIDFQRQVRCWWCGVSGVFGRMHCM